MTARLVGRFFTSVPRNIRHVMAYLRPTIEWRLEQENKHGPDWPGKPVRFDALRASV